MAWNIRYNPNLTAPVGGLDFVPASGFSRSLSTTAAHGNRLTITHDAGTLFGTRSNYNNGSNTWRTHQFLNHRFVDFEDTIDGNGFTFDVPGDAGAWSYDTVIKPPNHTKCLRRERSGASNEDAPLESRPNVNPTFVYASFLFWLPPQMQAGKFFRIWADNSRNIWWATGCDNRGVRATYEGSSTQIYNPGSPPYLIPEEQWVHFELFLNLATGVVQTVVDNAEIWSFDWINEAFLISTGSHTIDLGHMVDTPGAGRCSAHPTWDGAWGWSDTFLDFQRARLMLADNSVWANRTKAVPQLPVSWSPGSIDHAINQGFHSDLEGLHLFFVDSAESATRLGQFA